MTVRSVLNNFNKGFMICGVGSINYSQSNFMMSMVFYVLRCILSFSILYIIFYSCNTLIIKVEKEISEPMSIIYITCIELHFIGHIICSFWRVYFDNQLSIVLTKLEVIHEKLIRLKVVDPVKMKMNCYFIIGVIVYCATNIIPTVVWLIIQIGFDKRNLVIWVVATICELVAFNEFILLIFYIKWMVNVINEQIPERRSCLSTYRDTYLEVIECLHKVNRLIYGLPAIAVFIAGNVADIIGKLYGFILFPRDYIIDPYFEFSFINLSTKTFNILILYMIGDATEKEVFV